MAGFKMTKCPVPATLTVVTLLVMTSALCTGRTVIDLSYALKEGEDIRWPNFPRYNFSIMQRGYGSGDYSKLWMEYSKIEVAEHSGTHMDAPAHFIQDHWRMHEIPASRLMGAGVVVDVSEKVKTNDDYDLTVDDLKAWEAEHGTIPDGAVVLMSTGWGSRYPDRKRVFNSEIEDLSDTSKFHYPAVSGEAAQWLVDHRDITAVGVDSPSPDRGGLPFAAHLILLEKDVRILENVANLDKMPAAGTTVVIGGISIFEGSGAPTRLLAFLNDQQGKSDAPRGDLTGRFAAFLMLLTVVAARFCTAALS